MRQPTDPDIAFGELRSLLANDLKHASVRDDLLALLTRIQRLHPERYERRWRPYLNAVSVKWPRPFKQVRTLRWLEQWAGLSDVLGFGWSLDVSDMDDVVLLEDLFALSWSRHLCALTLSSSVRRAELSQRALGVLASASPEQRLSHIELAFPIVEVAALAELWEAPSMGQLSHLSLRLRGASGACCEALAHAPRSTVLRHLSIKHLEGECFKLFDLAEWMTQLESLDLSHSRFLPKDYSRIGELVLRTGLPSLNLTDMTVRQIELIFVEGFGQLKHLSLQDTMPNHKLFAQPLGQIEHLDLTDADLWYDWPELIEHATTQPHLNRLDLAGTGLSPELLRALCQKRFLPSVAQLGLANNDVFKDGVEALVHSEMANSLRRIDLRGALQEPTDLEPLYWNTTLTPGVEVVVDASMWSKATADLLAEDGVILVTMQ